MTDEQRDAVDVMRNRVEDAVSKGLCGMSLGIERSRVILEIIDAQERVIEKYTQEQYPREWRALELRTIDINWREWKDYSIRINGFEGKATDVAMVSSGSSLPDRWKLTIENPRQGVKRVTFEMYYSYIIEIELPWTIFTHLDEAGVARSLEEND